MSKKVKLTKPATWTVEAKIKGSAWLTVQASSKEEAEEKAWALYHDGTELDDLSWEVDDMEAGQ